MRILVVDDDPNQQLAIEALLEIGGHEALLTETAEKAYEVLAHTRVDAIVCDLSLSSSDQDGLVFAARLKSQPATRTVPILGVSGFPQDWVAHEALAAGCDAFMNKPLNPERFRIQLAVLTAASPQPDRPQPAASEPNSPA